MAQTDERDLRHFEGVCEAFGALVGEDVRRGVRCDDAETCNQLELELTGEPPGWGAARLWLIRSDGRRLCLHPYGYRDA